MSLQQLVGSMLMFGFQGDSLSDPQTREDVAELKAIHTRGVILFDHDLKANDRRNIDSPRQLAKLIEDLRNELGSELIVAIDQEGGRVARMDSHNGFIPTISAYEFSLLEEIDQIQYADRQAKQLGELGIDLNFAPCVDLAIEPGSPIIAGKERSFSESIDQVTRCAHIVIDAHARAGVRCCIKHYPGHGSSLLDSHKNICDVTRSHTDEESHVFRDLIKSYADQVAVMSGHLMHTKIDQTLPASLSRAHTTYRLRDELGFDGVVITDSLDMRAIRDNFGEGESAILAINAGADLILDGLNAPGFREPKAPTRIAHAICGAITDGRIRHERARIEKSRNRIDRFVRTPNSD